MKYVSELQVHLASKVITNVYSCNKESKYSYIQKQVYFHRNIDRIQKLQINLYEDRNFFTLDPQPQDISKRLSLIRIRDKVVRCTTERSNQNQENSVTNPNNPQDLKAFTKAL
jgi:hypothetical protein